MTTNTPPYFNANHLPTEQWAYVVWLDVMGTRPILTRSLPVAANFVFKTHVAALRAKPQGCTLYPVMDGVFVTSTSKTAITDFLQDAFTELAATLVHEPAERYQFVAKATVAFGPVVHGSDLKPAASKELAAAPAHRDSILLGMPMVQAIESEGKAPPFGVYIHESARAFAPTQGQAFNRVWWPWWQQNTSLRDQVWQKLDAYYRWAGAHAHSIEYDPNRLETHRKLAVEYFHLDF